jgi:hypothetical protein
VAIFRKGCYSTQLSSLAISFHVPFQKFLSLLQVCLEYIIKLLDGTLEREQGDVPGLIYKEIFGCMEAFVKEVCPYRSNSSTKVKPGIIKEMIDILLL